MSVIIKDMDKADRCADCQLLQTYQEHPFASVEMWCGVTDERIDNMQMVLPTCPIIADCKIENSSEKPNNYCDDCLYADTCDSKEFFYACTSKATKKPKDEPQTEEWYTYQDEQEYNARHGKE